MTGQDKFLLGTPSAGRFSRADRSVIGYCANPLLAPVDISAAETFSSHLADTQRQIRDVFALQRMPMAYALDQALTSRDNSEMALAPCFFTFIQERRREFAADYGYDLLWTQQRGAAHALNLLIYASGDKLEALWRYDMALFRQETVEGFARDFRHFMRALCDAPDAPLQNVMAEAWHRNEPGAPEKAVETALDRVDQQSEDSTAIQTGSDTLTYLELRSSAKGLAGALAERGVARGDRVALIIEDDRQRMIAMLACWYAGAAYLPLDPADPYRRLEQLIDLADAKLIISDVKPPLEAEVLSPLEQASLGEVRRPTAEDIAYIIFTSGTTGTPKPVGVPHRALVTYVDGLIARIGIDSGSSFASLAGPAADLGYTSLYGALLSGGVLHVLPTDAKLDATAFAAHLKAHPAEYLKITPSHFEALLEADDRILPDRALILGGEKPTSELVKSVKTLRPDLRIFNHYGPTETTIGVACGEISLSEAGDIQLDGVIGRALEGVELQILDPMLTPVPSGAIGELYVSGDQLAHGYLGAGAQTADRFVPNPFGTGGRLYRTGDRVRRLADAKIQFIGRADDQVKIRGFRVELGEIERALASLDGVKQCAVVTIGDSAKKLVACFVGSAEQSNLASGVADMLPAAMQPHYWLCLETLPRLANGKINRKELADVSLETFGSGKAHEAPVSNDETFSTLAQIWQDVLNTADLASEDNFFSLGGDSILSLQVVARAKKAGIALKPKDLFIHQTLGDLASFAARQSPVSREIEPVAEAQESYPLTPIQQWYFDTQPEAPAHWNQSLLLELPGPVGAPVFKAAATGLLQRHPILTGAFQRRDKNWKLVPGVIDDIDQIAVIDTLSDLDAVKTRCAMLEKSFSLNKGGLIRIALLTDSSTSKPYLFATAHHLIIDAVSWRNILSDLAVWITANPQETDADWAGLQLAQTEVTSDELVSATAYLETLASGEKDLQFGRFADSAGLTETLDSSSTAALLVDAVARLKLDPQDLMLAAFNRAWGQVTGENSVIIELEGHGRSADTANLIGWFTHRYPVSFDALYTDPHAALVQTANAIRSVPDAAKRAVALRFGENNLAPVRAPISFNYLGETGELGGAIPGVRRLDWPLGRMRDPGSHRLHGLNVTIEQVESELHIGFDITPDYLPLPKTEDLLTAFKDALVDIGGIEHRNRLVSEVTATDISPEELTDIADRLGDELEDVWPLTPVQEGMLLQAELTGRNDLYTNVAMFEIGRVESVESLTGPWAQLIERHPVLRGQVVSFEGQKWFAVLKSAEPKIDILDLSDLTPDEQNDQINKRFEAETRREFDLLHVPLMHITLCRSADDQWRLIWTRHHLISDGWTSALLAFEALTLASGGTLAPVPASKGYFDWINDQDIDAQRAYWKQLTGAARFDAQLPRAGADGAPVTIEEQINPGLQTRLDAAVKQHGVSLSTCLHLGWALALSDTIGTTHPLFGTVNAGRPPEVDGIDRIAGAFIQTLPAALQLNLSDRIETALQSLHGRLAEMRENGNVPLADLAGMFSAGQTRLFDTLLIVENYPMEAEGLALGDLTASLLQTDEKSDFPLTVQILPGERLRLLARTNGQVERQIVEGLIRRLLQALDFLASDTSEAIGAYFEHDLRRSPDKIETLPVNQPWFASRHFRETLGEKTDALLFQSESGLETVSGEDLLQDARAIARAVIELTRDRHARIAVALERTDWLPKTILGLHMAGICYVPVDLSQPEARRTQVIELAGCEALIGEGGHLPSDLAAQGRAFLSEDGSWEPPTPHLDELAYIIFTSGSTGEPKGVGISYRAVSHLLETFAQSLPNVSGARWMALTPLSFDIAYLELFAPLYHRGRLLLAPSDIATNGEAILDFTLKNNADILQATPSSWSIISGALDEQPDALKDTVLISGGEALPSALANMLRSHGKSLCNVYGPTEACIWSSIARLDNALGDASIAPLGKPFKGEGLYALDAFLRPLNIGDSGDLWISGQGLARGYVDRPDLTADAFAPDPFGAPGTRMYRTGDRVKLGEDGVLHFLGRSDSQIKLRGHRIEIGEVEAALASAPGIASGAVLHVDADTARARLVAYAVPIATPADETAWRAGIVEHLSSRLVDAAIPSQIMCLDEMPLTSSGKINRKALPAPFIEQAGGTPETERETWLAAAWTDLLDLPDAAIIGRETRFFELGANSITAARLVARVKAELGIELLLVAIFEESALHKMASALDAAPGAQSDEELAFMAELLDDLE
ncbi:MAG: amino acid adenylation domain-containing protein [Pseudomonadota bacterium]